MPDDFSSSAAVPPPLPPNGVGGSAPPPPPPPPPPYPPYTPRSGVGRVVDGTLTQGQRTYAIFLHISALTMLALGPFSIFVPLTMWLIRRDESAYLDDQGQEAMNFHLSLILYGTLGVLLLAACGVGFAVLIFALVLLIIGLVLGSVAASRGEYFRYPLCIRLIRVQPASYRPNSQF